MVKDFMITFIKTFFMNLCIFFSFEKIKVYKKADNKNIILLNILNVIVSLTYATLYEYINFLYSPIFMNLICYTIYYFMVVTFVDENKSNFFVKMLLSICFSLSAFFLSSIIIYYLTKIVFIDNKVDSIIVYLLIGIVQFLLSFSFFRIKRFKDGFSFLKEDRFSKSINIINIILSIIFIIFIAFGINTDKFVAKCIACVIILGIVVMMSLIRKSITKHYKLKMKDKTVEHLQQQLREKDQVISDLRAELDATLKINHKYNHRISAVEKAISKLNFNEEFANENGDIINLVKELSADYKDEISSLEKQNSLLKTGIFGVDNIIEYMYTEAKKDNISFIVEVNCDIKVLNEKEIKQSKLETLLADHIKDAIIAINYGNNNSRQIKLSFNKIDNIYEIKISDTGINFEIETLLKLGQEQITTHKESGGSGIGFMTTFETLKECKGSLIIEEYNNDNEDYTKSIIIKFDNKNEYRVRSYRAEEIKQQDKLNRLIVENK